MSVWGEKGSNTKLLKGRRNLSLEIRNSNVFWYMYLVCWDFLNKRQICRLGCDNCVSLFFCPTLGSKQDLHLMCDFHFSFCFTSDKRHFRENDRENISQFKFFVTEEFVIRQIPDIQFILEAKINTLVSRWGSRDGAPSIIFSGVKLLNLH